MGRRWILLALGACLGAMAFGRLARAEASGMWEAEFRAGFDGAVRQSVRDVFSRPRFGWDRGPVMWTRTKALAVHVGYEGQFDAVWYGRMDEAVEAAAGARWTSGFERRRSRVAVEVFFLRHWFLRARYGWGNFDVLSFQDLYLEWSGLTRRPGSWWPVLRIGQVKEPMTLDWMNSALRTTFAERAMFTTSIVPNRSVGVRAHGIGPGKRFTYQVGTYLVDVTELSEQSHRNGEAVTGRITALPWAPKDRPDHLLHVGLAASYRWDLDTYRAKAKPESWVGPAIVDTGKYAAEGATVVSGELFLQRGRLSFTAEGAWTAVRLPDGPTVGYWGAYGQVSCFLTAGHIPYNRTLGCYGRVQPERTIFCPARSGLGDVELAARWSILDLTDGPDPGGRAWNVTLALNWYARDNLRVYLNYVYSDVADAYGAPGADGTMSTLLVRLGYDL